MECNPSKPRRSNRVLYNRDRWVTLINPEPARGGVLLPEQESTRTHAHQIRCITTQMFYHYSTFLMFLSTVLKKLILKIDLCKGNMTIIVILIHKRKAGDATTFKHGRSYWIWIRCSFWQLKTSSPVLEVVQLLHCKLLDKQLSSSFIAWSWVHFEQRRHDET